MSVVAAANQPIYDLNKRCPRQPNIALQNPRIHKAAEHLNHKLWPTYRVGDSVFLRFLDTNLVCEHSGSLTSPSN